MKYYPHIKRFLDIIGAVVGLVVLMPLFIVIGIIIRTTMGSPVLYRQVRPGKNGKPFVVYKFRTMLDLKDEQGNLLPDEKRITGIGNFLRSTSLDEFPELYNVLKGDMSLVGPRPLLMEYLNKYSPEQARRHEVKPGITGWSQVNGRNTLNWDQRFELDVWYVDNISLWHDIKILWYTVVKVLKREGINADGHTTMPRFEGSERKMGSI